MHARPQLFHDLSRCVIAALPEVRVTRSRLYALMAIGMILAGRVSLPAIARQLNPTGHHLSTERRLRRFLANPQVTVPTLWHPVLQRALPRLIRRDALLVFDPTPCGKRATLLMLGLVVHHRVLPVAWRVVPQQERWPTPMATALDEMVAAVAPLFPPHGTVTVLLDRGLVGADIVDTIRRFGWMVVLRLHNDRHDQTRVRLANGTECRVVDLLSGPGQRRVLPVQLFKQRHWRDGWLTIHWDTRAREPFVLFSDRCGGRDRVREYRKRVHCEATYADWKRRGFRLSDTRLTGLDRIDRLMAVLALVTWWLHGLGQTVIKRGWRRRYDRSDRRDVSLIKLGRLHLLTCLDAEHRVPLPLDLPPPALPTRRLQTVR
jgi:hypothetical protein